MRSLLFAAALSLLLSGCASSPAEPEIAETDDVPVANVTIPDPLHFTGQLQSVALPVTGMTTECNYEGGCTTHDFTIEDPLQVTILLDSIDGTVTGTTAQVIWGSDYDMSLLKGGTQLAESTNPGADTDEIVAELDPGTYTVQVRAWNDQDGSYDLTIDFAAIPPEEDDEDEE